MSVSKSGSFGKSKTSGSKIEPRKMGGNAIGYRYPALDIEVCCIESNVTYEFNVLEINFRSKLESEQSSKPFFLE